jgi:hypothetical protein
MKAYPDSRVFCGFTFAPMVGGLLWFLFALISDILSHDSFAVMDRIIESFPLLVGLLFLGQILFGMLAVIFALIYIHLQLTKNFLSFIKISVISFVGTALCSAVAVAITPFSVVGVKVFYFASLAMVSSWIVAWCVLPKPEKLNQE